MRKAEASRLFYLRGGYRIDVLVENKPTFPKAPILPASEFCCSFLVLVFFFLSRNGAQNYWENLLYDLWERNKNNG